MTTTAAIPIKLSNSKADNRWGDNVLLSASDNGITIHLTSNDILNTIQIAARKINIQGIKRVILIGTQWDLEKCWSFWQGYRDPKKQYVVDWPPLIAKENQELSNRIKIIDWVRHTINTPAEELGPEELAQCAVDIVSSVADENCISYHITPAETLFRNNYMGIYTVGRGSNRQPVLLTLDYNPNHNGDALLACLVGKGITFDSGGYSLKASKFMVSMKADMGGAATITGALALAISRGLKKRVKLILCCADNMVSSSAFKLGDLISYRNGKSVEVMNTDAEGRIVLADGLIDASYNKPQFIIDCATLTGAAQIALGNDYHALFSFDDMLVTSFLASATAENELFWRLPLAEFHRNHLPSNFADISNVAGSAYSAGASTAAAFLSHFVNNYRYGWLHIDCSANYREEAVDQWSAGATGLGVRTIANFLLVHARTGT